MRVFKIVVASTLWGGVSLQAQQNLAVDVRVTSASRAGDTTVLSYVVANSPNSQERLFRFIVDGPAPVVRIDTPAPAESWLTSTRQKGLSVAAWGILGSIVPPGSSSPALTFGAIGLPTVVTYWATGHFRPRPYQALEEGTQPPAARDAIAAGSVSGKTVGVEPFPADLTPANLLIRLRGLTDQACDSLAWIGSTTVCSSLRGNVDRASQALAQGDTGGARSELTSFVAELDSQHGTSLPVNDSAYWLLKVNAEFITGRL
jgi:hypothetical protein